MNQSREYNKLKKIKIFNLFSTLIILGTFSATFLFVYNNVYKTIGQLETLSVIQNIKNFEAINFKNYQETVEAWGNKNQGETIINPSRDLFSNNLILPTSTLQADISTTSTPETATSTTN
jgi:predicted PurR-regulated permease PerM